MQEELQQHKNLAYEKEIKELKEKYNINIGFKGKNPVKIKNYIKN